MKKINYNFPYLKLIIGMLLSLINMYISAVYGIKHLISHTFGVNFSYTQAIQTINNYPLEYFIKAIFVYLIWAIIAIIPMIVVYRKNSVHKKIIFWCSFFALSFNLGIVSLIFIIWAVCDKPLYKINNEKY